ncbi:MAG: hypothetical protein AAGF72_19210 [Pseudomonadota bacterium]
MQQSRIEFGNLAHDALAQIGETMLSKKDKLSLEENLADIADDDTFWQFQSESLVVFATPERVRTFRLPNHLTDGAQVSDRFHLPPLMRALAFPHSATVLVLGQGGVRVLGLTGDRPAGEVRLPDMPKSAADAARKASIGGRAPKRRLQGSEGQKVHLLAYARRVDDALRSYLGGREDPLIVVANEPLRSIFLSVCSYETVIAAHPTGVGEDSSDEELATASRELIDELYAAEVSDLVDTYKAKAGIRRATSKVTDVARSSTFGGVDTLLVNMDATLSGTVSEEEGTVTYAPEGAESYDILSELACRTLLTGGRVLSVRQTDLPETEPVAAILRHPV